MIPLERREKIVSLLEERKMATVEALAGELFVSGATLRRDLQILEEEGRIRRTHGGAALPLQSMQEMPMLSRRMERRSEKQSIAHAASRLISPNDTLILDSSTTALALGTAMRDMGSLTVISSGLLTVQAFAVPGRSVLCTGGIAAREFRLIRGRGRRGFSPGPPRNMEHYLLPRADRRRAVGKRSRGKPPSSAACWTPEISICFFVTQANLTNTFFAKHAICGVSISS